GVGREGARHAVTRVAVEQKSDFARSLDVARHAAQPADIAQEIGDERQRLGIEQRLLEEFVLVEQERREAHLMQLRFLFNIERLAEVGFCRVQNGLAQTLGQLGRQRVTYHCKSKRFELGQMALK